MEDSENKRPIDIIRAMNPRSFIPTGQELADLIKKKNADEEFDWKICQRCGTPISLGNKFCSSQCKSLFNQRK